MTPAVVWAVVDDTGFVWCTRNKRGEARAVRDALNQGGSAWRVVRYAYDPK